MQDNIGRLQYAPRLARQQLRITWSGSHEIDFSRHLDCNSPILFRGPGSRIGATVASAAPAACELSAVLLEFVRASLPTVPIRGRIVVPILFAAAAQVRGSIRR